LFGKKLFFKIVLLTVQTSTLS